jgi:hypothetical protein
MNIPKLFEGAVATAIQTHAKLDAMPRLRVWQAINEDLTWTPTSDREFPLLDIRCGPPGVADDGVALSCNVQVMVATHATDDQDHQQMSRIYEAAQTVMDALYSQFRQGAAGAERETFDAYIRDTQPDAAALISVGGFEYGESVVPFEDSMAYFMGLNFMVHFSRSDY